MENQLASDGDGDEDPIDETLSLHKVRKLHHGKPYRVCIYVYAERRGSPNQKVPSARWDLLGSRRRLKMPRCPFCAVLLFTAPRLKHKRKQLNPWVCCKKGRAELMVDASN